MKSRPQPLYSELAHLYARMSDTSAYNVWYDRPAVLALLPGDIAGRDLLDVGCASGSLTAALLARGARVQGFDESEPLLGMARERLGPNVPLHHGDLAAPLPFADTRFDGVTASLVLHYLRDWIPTLRELRRVLRPGGWVVLSTHHPMGTWRDHPAGSYFEDVEVEEHWRTEGNERAPVRFFRRSLGAMFMDFRAAGFDVDALVEPRPAPGCAAADPKAHARLEREPAFLLFRLIRSD